MYKAKCMVLALVGMTVGVVCGCTPTTQDIQTEQQMVDTPSENPTADTKITLFSDIAYATNGGWTSGEFSTTKENGNAIRFWHDNTTDEAVAVYLFRIDGTEKTRVASMKIDAHTAKEEVYSEQNADDGTYCVNIEAYPSGGLIDGDICIEQYTQAPKA